MKNKRVIMIIVFVLIILLSIIGVSYAMYRYSRNGSINNKQIVGDIYMHYNEEELGIDSNGEGELTSLYSLNATEENINACVTYLYNTYGESWNGLTYELDESCDSSSGGPAAEKYIPNNTLAKFMSISGVCSHTYEEYCSNDYEQYNYNNGGGNVSVSYKNSFSTTARFMDNDSSDSPYYNAILNDYLNGVMTTADKTYFKNNNIIVDATTTIPYFEFTIDGKNTYNKKDIWYDINLEYGSNHATRTERIKDEYLKFTLLEIENGNINVLFRDRSYDSLNNKRIWVDTISSSDGVVNRTYRLYMSYIDNIKVGNTIEGNDYLFDTWNNEVYGSVKVKVTGDFTEKTIDYTETNTPEGCFETDVLTFYSRNPNMTTNELNTCVTYIANNIVTDSYIVNPSMNQTELDACVNYFNNTLNYSWDAGEDATSFCNGTGTNWGATFQEKLDDADFSYEEENYMLSQNIIILEDKTETATNFCNGVGTIDDYTFQEYIDSSYGFTSEQLTYLLSENIILSTNYNAITNYDSSCGRDVVIPSSIGGNIVDAIDYNKFQSNLAFSGSSLTSVKFPNTLKYIAKGAFKNNNLLTVNIPSSVESNLCDVFDYNVVINTNQNLVCNVDYSVSMETQSPSVY